VNPVVTGRDRDRKLVRLGGLATMGSEDKWVSESDTVAGYIDFDTAPEVSANPWLPRLIIGLDQAADALRKSGAPPDTLHLEVSGLTFTCSNT
jgi:hypothetical protein